MKTFQWILFIIFILSIEVNSQTNTSQKSADAVREALFRNIETVILNANRDEMNVFAPDHYTKAIDAYNSALATYEHEGSLKKIRSLIHQAQEMFQKGFVQAEKTKKSLIPIMKERSVLDITDPEILYKKEAQAADHWVKEAITFLEKGNEGEAKLLLEKSKDFYKAFPKEPFRPIPLFIQLHNDPNELSISDGKDYQRLILHVADQKLWTSIRFYGSRNLSEFFCYFGTDMDMAAEICIRCQPTQFEASAETSPGWYNTHLYTGTPQTSTHTYTMELPWTTLFGNLDTLQCWLYAMDGKDRLPDAGDVLISWWELTSSSKTEATLYQGNVDYQQTPEGWWMRTDGEVDDRNHFFFPNSTVTNADVTALLSSIGCATTLTEDDTEIWSRTVQVWNWLQTHQLTSGANYTAAMTYYQSLGSWPSLAEIAYMFTHFGGIYWGTCMSRAQLFATLLLGVGIHPDRFAIAEAYWQASYSQHMFVILYVGGHWYYLDPTYIHESIAATPGSIGSGSADYVHPLRIITLPGSTLSYVPLVE